MSFNEYAKTWDTEKRIKRAAIIAKQISKSLDKVLDISKEYTAMEFGCGTGLISFNLRNKFKKISLIDSSKEMIEILKNKIEKFKVENMVPYHLDIFKDKQLNEKFDVIFNSMVLHHIKSIEDISDKFYELLNDDGYLVIIDLDEEDGSFHKKYPEFNLHNGFHHKELKTIVEEVGFKDVSVDTFYHGVKIVDGKKINYSLFILLGRKEIGD